MIVIRPAEPRDLPSILAIVNDAILNSTAWFETQPHDLNEQARWLEMKRAAGWPVLVADDGIAVGWASFGVFRDRPGYIHTVEHSVYVARKAQGRGVGGALLGALIADARRRGLHAMIGGVEASNGGSLAFHAALGFAEVGRLPQVGQKFGRWLDLVFMQKLL